MSPGGTAHCCPMVLSSFYLCLIVYIKMLIQTRYVLPHFAHQLPCWQITMRVYGSLPLPMLVSAHYNVKHHLSKLLSDGKAEEGWLPSSFRLVRRAVRTNALRGNVALS